jgi:ERCC4-type nuclease
MILIDFREKDIITHCTNLNLNKNIEIKTENLLLGDIQINKLLIERKSINDLAASIVDGRYKEQSFRLSKALDEGFKVFYFIEGNLDAYKGKLTKNTLVSAIYSLTTKGFQVLLTKNSNESAFFILQFAEKMNKNQKENDTLIKSEGETNISYENTEGVVQTKKNKNITKDNISVFMLCQIPGISTTTAGILLQKYGHITNLIISMKQNPNEFEEFRNNDKKLNRNIIKNLNEYLNI